MMTLTLLSTTDNFRFHRQANLSVLVSAPGHHLTKREIAGPKLSLFSVHTEEKSLAIHRDLALSGVADECGKR